MRIVEMQYANYHGYSDIHPYEVVKKISDKTLEIRKMNAEQDPTWNPIWEVGGFAGHCANSAEQRWIITSDENLRTLRIRLHKDGVWRDRYGSKYRLSEKPRRFYDYNF